MYTVILYYKYIAVPVPETERLSQRTLCEELGLKGRILLGAEGINGTLAGSDSAVAAYIETMNRHPQFGGIEYKYDTAPAMPFPRLRIKVRPEIVTLGVEVDPANTAPKLTPEQFHKLIQDPDIVLFDARNNYESAIGRFRGAVTPDIKLFKDLPGVLGQYEGLKDKTVVTYCTGGIRCEKASALMKQQGFKKIYQLDGGIIKYAQAYPEGAFEGSCFVFDERMSVSFTENPIHLGVCRFCAGPTSRYCNCANPECHELMLVCGGCGSSQTCSAACATRLEATAAPA